MATLEIHDGRNRVRRVRITRDNPVMFGSDPMCDVVLDGAGRPAVPRPDPLEDPPVQGRRLARGPLDRGQRPPGQVQEPLPGGRDPGRPLPDLPPERRGRPRPRREDRRIRRRPDAPARPPARRRRFHRMEMAPPSIESGPDRRSRTRPGRGRSARSGRPNDRASRSPSTAAARAVQEPGDSLRADAKAGDAVGRDPGARRPAAEAPAIRGPARRPLFGSFDRAPGDDRVFTSPMVIGPGRDFAVLVALQRRALGDRSPGPTPTGSTASAVEDMEAGDFPNAIKRVRPLPRRQPRRPAGRQGPGPPGPGPGPPAHRDRRGLVGQRAQGGPGDGRRGRRPAGVSRLQHGPGRGAPQGRRGAGRPGRPSWPTPRSWPRPSRPSQLHARVAGQAAASLIERSKVPEKLGQGPAPRSARPATGPRPSPRWTPRSRPTGPATPTPPATPWSAAIPTSPPTRRWSPG